MDLTGYGADPTGRELSLKQLSRPDERHLNMPDFSTEAYQAVFLRELDRLSPSVPEEVIDRLTVAKDMAIYGLFRYEFYSVSLFWSLTTIEMALADRLLHWLPKPVVLKKKENTLQFQGNYEMLNDQLRRGWRIEGHKSFHGGFRDLLLWAKTEQLLDANTAVILDIVGTAFENRRFLSSALGKHPPPPSCTLDVLVDGIPMLRNQLAHPRDCNWLVPPGVPQRGFMQSICLIGQLWPKSHEGT